VVDTLEEARLEALISRVKTDVAGAVRDTPRHQRYLSQYCAAPAGQAEHSAMPAQVG